VLVLSDVQCLSSKGCVGSAAWVDLQQECRTHKCNSPFACAGTLYLIFKRPVTMRNKGRGGVTIHSSGLVCMISMSRQSIPTEFGPSVRLMPTPLLSFFAYLSSSSCLCLLYCRDAKSGVVAASLAVVHIGPHPSCHSAHPPMTHRKLQRIFREKTQSRRALSSEAHKERKIGTFVDKSARWCEHPTLLSS
jgi:hypothetical protein